MQVEARGVPAHTRTLSVTLRHADQEGVDFAAYVLDLRKRGFVPVGGDIQGPGIIHHMSLGGRLGRASSSIEAIRAEMPTIAFEATPATGGESCRDRIDRVQGLAGMPLSGGYASRVGAEIGGTQGCSHVLTLGHLLGPTAVWGLDEERRLLGESPGWRRGERIFRRDIVVDGADREGDLAMVALLNDLHMRPQAAEAEAAERFARQVEIRVGARLRLADMRILEIDVAERRRGPEDLESASWRPRPDRAEPLVGLSLRSGVARDLIERFQGDDRDRPLLDLLLMLAPATLQCVASFIDTYTRTGGAGRAAAETGGHPDSCYMWRRDGAMQRRRLEAAARATPPGPQDGET
jgi:hypothetical protein